MKYYIIKRAYDFLVGVNAETIEYFGPDDIERAKWSIDWLQGISLKPEREALLANSIRLILVKMIELEGEQRNSFKQSA
jgi:hypothetical protein